MSKRNIYIYIYIYICLNIYIINSDYKQLDFKNSIQFVHASASDIANKLKKTNYAIRAVRVEANLLGTSAAFDQSVSQYVTRKCVTLKIWSRSWSITFASRSVTFAI